VGEDTGIVDLFRGVRGILGPRSRWNQKYTSESERSHWGLQQSSAVRRARPAMRVTQLLLHDRGDQLMQHFGFEERARTLARHVSCANADEHLGSGRRSPVTTWPAPWQASSLSKARGMAAPFVGQSSKLRSAGHSSRLSGSRPHLRTEALRASV